MKFFVAAMLSVAGMMANAADVSVDARRNTCSSINQIVNERGSAEVLVDGKNAITAVSSARQCLENGYIYSKFESVRAADGWCHVLVCDPYFGGM